MACDIPASRDEGAPSRRTSAGRELRLRSSELAELMRRPAVMAGIGNREELTPEKEADLYV